MQEYALVPVEDINKIEQARKELHMLIDKYYRNYPEFLNITGKMWELTHRRYKKQMLDEKDVDSLPTIC